MATGWPMKTTYANGDVFSSSDVNDITGTINLLTSSTLSQSGGKNAVINGGFDFFQRSAFASKTSNGYNLDRWYCSLTGTITITQQTTGVPSGSNYCARVAYNAATSVGNLYQALESATVATMQGKTVTLSAKLRRNASFAANITIGVFKNSTGDTLTGGSWTLIGTTTITNANLPTGTTSADWYSASLTVAIPNDGTANGLRVTIAESATGASGAYWEVAQVQLELGSTATTFSRAGGTIQGELAACQRYYFKTTTGRQAVGYAKTTSVAECIVFFPVEMRIVPTALEQTGTAADYLLVYQNSAAACSAVPTFENGNKNNATTRFTVAGSLTAGNGLVAGSNSGTSFLAWSAEL